MEDDVYEAELHRDDNENRLLTGIAGATIAVSIVFLMVSVVFTDIAEKTLNEDTIDYGVRVPVWQRGELDYITNLTNGFVMEFGDYEIFETANEWNSTHVFVEYEIPIEEGGAAPNGKISLAYWRPNVPEGVQVPVIAEFGPYFQEQSVQTPTIEVPGSWLGEMVIDQILPHGYAFAQISVTGTGRSNHCMDLMGTAEQLGNDAAVTWLGSQDWSNGNVAMIGKSYDGSTPWQAAMFGNEHLKTIVPISGLIGVKELMWKNGSSEARAPIMHNGVYGSYGFDGDEEDYGNLCPDYIIGPGTGVSAWMFGSEIAGDYWAERYFLDRVLENYGGSVYLIQGMHDWNVDPHMAVPTINLLKDNGIESKGLFGQWDHDYPDRTIQLDERSDLGGRGGEAFPEMIRFDWMQDLLEWFDWYLKGEGRAPELHVEIQSNQGAWRIEDRYPASDNTELIMSLGSELVRVSGGDNVLPDASTGPVYQTEPLTSDLYIQGMPRLHVEVSTTTVGGQLYALLEDCDGSNCIHLGHAIMDLRYHEGGEELSTTWTPIVSTITAKMEFFALDAEVAEGHTIRLSLLSRGEDYLPASTSSIVTIVEGEGSTLQLDIFDYEDKLYWTPPVCTHPVCE
jgi:predicted acyl esterase